MSVLNKLIAFLYHAIIQQTLELNFCSAFILIVKASNDIFLREDIRQAVITIYGFLLMTFARNLHIVVHVVVIVMGTGT